MNIVDFQTFLNLNINFACGLHCLKDEMDHQEHRKNFMTVPAALKELEKIEI